MPGSITPPDTARPRAIDLERRLRAADRTASLPAEPTRSAPPRRSRTCDRFRLGLDILIAAVALTLLAPLLGVVAVLIKLSSPGPVLYQQVRVGLDHRGRARRAPRPAPGPGDRRGSDRRACAGHGRPFRIYKLRTMVPNAEEYGPQWSHNNDPRIFPLGRLLRLTRLDETPQFLNVLRGDMSLIGPRPERPYFVAQFAESIPDYRDRLRVRPGITGRAQVSLDYDSSIDDVKKKLEQDLLYIRRRSVRGDLAILAQTVWVILTGRGAC